MHLILAESKMKGGGEEVVEKVWNLEGREEEELGEMEQNEDPLRGYEKEVENPKKRKRNKGGIENCKQSKNRPH